MAGNVIGAMPYYPGRLTVRTLAFHARNQSSILCRDTNFVLQYNMTKLQEISSDALQEIVSDSASFREVCHKLGYKATTGTLYKRLRVKFEEDQIDFSHFKCHSGYNFRPTKTPLDEVMIENSTYGASHLKARLLENGMLRNECSICGITEWNNTKLVMITDHISGVNNDHREENLRMVCPNCNSQLDTHCRK